MQSRTPILILAIVITLSGCAGNGGKAALSASSVPTVATHTEETGGIEGLVVDEEVQPIGGATVGIVGATQVAQTSANGEFALSELTPGSYKVAVQALGFKSVVKPVEVLAGNVTTVQFTLEALPVPAPPPNLLTPSNNVLWLHTNNAARKIWMNDSLEAADGETLYYGVNFLAFANTAGTVVFTVPLDPGFPESVPLDLNGRIDVTLYFGGYFTGQDHGKFSVRMELMNGETRVFAGAAKEVTMINGEGAKILWDGVPEVNILDKDKDLSWKIYATGPSMGYSIRCSGSNVNTCERSRIVLPVI